MSERRIPRIKTESEKFSVARLTRENQHFEILIKPQKALDYRNGKISGLTEVLAAEIIFSDANKGTKVSEEAMEKIFKTTDMLKIADEILKKGTLQLTTDQRRKMVEDKKRQIIDFISRQAVDPKTNLPHPPLRIENAMDQIRYSIDPYKPVEEQAKDIVKLLRPILPLKVEQITVAIKIPTQYAARAYGAIKIFGVIKREEWRSDGSWFGELELPAGTYASLLNKLGDVTKGNGEAKIIS
ncbi:MAG: ribosome assembly factor SBDS [Candidatus Bathyarchaeota archaeon]|nr:ribosome assembly factor SBDS [Candidatus Bathyarchaeota archaeon]MDD4324814.1 ribosome assembly factor SBDS [Candidatus Bathyarchaeota archaeon]MDI9577660.1 ribosome assembly factor SBDS [Thermoproteota archaeon]MDT8781431.1 ribosome assembly factor SBDS [Candidatus Bathyarchaeota archaeon]NLD65413.1 ribosome assembly factor SBDS [Thermoproteota archaeon]